VVWSDIKKSAKSCLAAAVALERMTDLNWGSTKIIGNDIKQADSRTAFYARRAVHLNPRLARQIEIIKYRLNFNNQSVIEAIPIDPTGEAGGNDDLIIYTEAWGLKDKKDIQMWEEQRISPTKFGRGQIWVESYAGYKNESPVLWNLYETGVLNGKRIDVGIDGLELYENGSQLTLWNTTPRCWHWQTPEYYASEAASMTDSAFNRVHRNQWQSAQDKFIPDEWWAACKQESLPALREAQPMVLAVDANESDDCFGLLLVSRHDDNVAIRYCRKWQPQKGQKQIYVNEDDPDDVDYPEGEIRRLAKEFNVVELAYDKFQLHDMMNRLRHKLGINCRSFKQSDERAIADKQLYDLVKERRILHSGEIDLAEHIGNAHKKDESDKIRIVKGSSSAKKIDLAVCLSMCAHRALKLSI
jgi:phage terminase large subunit-like protein